jgi:hypothetical protein
MPFLPMYESPESDESGSRKSEKCDFRCWLAISVSTFLNFFLARFRWNFGFKISKHWNWFYQNILVIFKSWPDKIPAFSENSFYVKISEKISINFSKNAFFLYFWQDYLKRSSNSSKIFVRLSEISHYALPDTFNFSADEFPLFLSKKIHFKWIQANY